MPHPTLSPVEQRILGSLLEKQVTVPASYPLSLNALRTACNQTSSREPVTDYDEQTIERTCRELKQRELLRIVWASTGRRTLKYHQTLAERLDLDDAEQAILTVLLLRGEQSAGELRTRTERLHPFADKSVVEEVLRRMAEREEPLVRLLERRAGERDPRWTHLLGDPAQMPSTRAADARTDDIDLDTRDERVLSAYGAVAAAYAEGLGDELGDLPLERWLLERVVELANGAPVVEVGCGPGHVTAYLAACGANSHGIDVTPAMIEAARRIFPTGSYAVGDLRRLMRPTDADGWGAVLAWYSLIHLTDGELDEALAALVRPLRPGGWLVYAGHAGESIRHISEWFGEEVDLHVVQRDPRAVAAAFERAGLTDVEWYARGPHAGRGETTERTYVLGRRSA